MFFNPGAFCPAKRSRVQQLRRGSLLSSANGTRYLGHIVAIKWPAIALRFARSIQVSGLDIPLEMLNQVIYFCARRGLRDAVR